MNKVGSHRIVHPPTFFRSVLASREPPPLTWDWTYSGCLYCSISTISPRSCLRPSLWSQHVLLVIHTKVIHWEGEPSGVETPLSAGSSHPLTTSQALAPDSFLGFWCLNPSGARMTTGSHSRSTRRRTWWVWSSKGYAVHHSREPDFHTSCLGRGRCGTTRHTSPWCCWSRVRVRILHRPRNFGVKNLHRNVVFIHPMFPPKVHGTLCWPVRVIWQIWLQYK